MPAEWKNKLYFGDNLDILRRYVEDESVDLIYLDPPFNSQASYNVLFKEQDGSRPASQIRAFDDFWQWDTGTIAVYHEVLREGPGKVADLLKAMHDFLGGNPMMAYLTMMALRLVELHRVLKPTGSLYLHCDPTASHYLKMVMDAVFGTRNFRREIVWRSGWVSGFKSAAKNWIRNHDVILFYLKDIKENWNFNLPFVPHEPDYKRRGGKGANPKGIPMDDVWTDIYSPAIMSFSREKLGYPTQKPEALLERIISASSNEGDLVLDPFCGCGTTVAVAERLHRRWIGIDVTHLAINLMRTRLVDTFGPDLSTYEVIGEPQDLESARALALQDRYQFQYWALSLVGARPAGEPKKGADRGVDGYLYFSDDDTGAAKKLVISVKSGHVTRHQVGDLIAVMQRENAEMALFLTLEPSTSPMRQEAAEAGMYQPPGLQPPIPRVQILTVEELLSGSKLELPVNANRTFQRAPRQQKAKPRARGSQPSED